MSSSRWEIAAGVWAAIYSSERLGLPARSHRLVATARAVRLTQRKATEAVNYHWMGGTAMTFWRRRVDDRTLDIISRKVGLEIDPYTWLPFDKDELRHLALMIEKEIPLQLPLYVSDKWTSVEHVMASVRHAMALAMQADAA